MAERDFFVEMTGDTFASRVAITKAGAGAIVALLIVATAGFYFASSVQLPASQSVTTTTTTVSATSTTSTTSANSLTSSTGSVSVSLTSLRASGAWTTYQRDSTRSGFDPSEPSATNIKLSWTSQTLDGMIYAQPLVFAGMVIVVTEGDSIYALSELNGSVIWRTHVGSSVPRSELPCGNIDPTGITGTPVIDATSNTAYLVAFLEPPHHELFAVDLRNGAVSFHRAVDPPGADPIVHQQRGALAMANGLVYIPYGGLNGDCGNYHGWVVGTSTGRNDTLLSFQVPTHREGGIWAPSGIMVDKSGNVYVATGNGDSSSTFDFGNAVIKLSPTLKELDWFAPGNWQQLNGADKDLGSVGPSLVANHTIFQIGKEGVGFLLSTDRLGGIGGQVFSAQVCQASYGGVASANSYVFVPCTDGLAALNLSSRGDSFTVAWRGPQRATGPPIVAGGAVWTLNYAVGVLYVFDMKTGNILFTSNVGSPVHFSSMSAADGSVFVLAGDHLVSYSLQG